MKEPKAYVVLKKNRLALYSGSVFMENGTEFQIELDNPTKNKVLAEVSINGNVESNGIILRPGERVYLERFLDSDKKLKFETYSVPSENFKEADKSNGEVKVNFYLEDVFKTVKIQRNPFNQEPFRGTNYWSSTFTNSNANTSTNFQLSNYLHVAEETPEHVFLGQCSSPSLDSSENDEKETGRIEKGGQSSQEFITTDGDFQFFPFNTTIIKIKPYESKPKDKVIRRYCAACGCKIMQKFKFCPQCGESI